MLTCSQSTARAFVRASRHYSAVASLLEPLAVARHRPGSDGIRPVRFAGQHCAKSSAAGCTVEISRTLPSTGNRNPGMRRCRKSPKAQHLKVFPCGAGPAADFAKVFDHPETALHHSADTSKRTAPRLSIGMPRQAPD